MFGRIARTYDILNRVFSLGVDRRWRRKAIESMELIGDMAVLDCGAGTGDMSLTAHRADRQLVTCLLDPSQEMLSIADGKAGFIRPAQYVLIRGAAESLPFRPEAFDRFMVAFGIRNFADLSGGLAELYRVLRKGGRGVVLEFTPDRSRLITRVFSWYMSKVMAPLGGWISGEAKAYSYLSRTVENFATSTELTQLFVETGFNCARVVRLSAGIATLFVLERPASSN
jgi:demethylmenaquinone methyltransferase/2-methoxy-6-polyprenyl-1,4-benzoquinol methylase